MIPGTASLTQLPQEPAAWQAELANAISDPAELLSLLGLGEEWLPGARAAARLFPLRVPRGFVARMRPRDPHDPLLRQVLPLGDECLTADGFSSDPVGDHAAMVAPGVLHKYHGRVLLTVTGACAVHCRYCFRRHFDYGDANPASDQWRAPLEYLASNPSVSEVILSGGDPLSLSDRRLTDLVGRLEAIPHIQRLRIHTRTAVVLPSRITEVLLSSLSRSRLTAVMVIHANHANEIDSMVRERLGALRSAGVTLLNQSVLLRGVNDDASTLTQLSEALFGAGVLPYYLHLLDRVSGAAHFEVSPTSANRLYQELQARLPGYLVPKLVREIAGAQSKSLASWS